MPLPTIVDPLGNDRYRCTWAGRGAVEVTRTRERSYGGVTREAHRDAYHIACDLLNDPPKRVLDVGCGSGYGSEMLARQGYSVLGLDASAEAIAFARYRAPRAWFRLCDVGREPLPLMDGEVEVVVAVESIEHVADDARMFREFARVLEDDGVLFFTTPNATCPTRPSAHEENVYHVREYEPDDLGQRLIAAGFRPVQWVNTPGYPVLVGYAIKEAR